MGGWLLDIKGVNKVYRNLRLHLLGQYQPLNLSLALVLSELYLKNGKRKIIDEKLKEILPDIRVRGRFEIIRKRPVVVADAAHNPEGIKNFVEDIVRYFGKYKKIIIFHQEKYKNT